MTRFITIITLPANVVFTRERPLLILLFSSSRMEIELEKVAYVLLNIYTFINESRAYDSKYIQSLDTYGSVSHILYVVWTIFTSTCKSFSLVCMNEITHSIQKVSHLHQKVEAKRAGFEQ